MAVWVYILKCADGSYYAGCTTDLDQRLNQHSDGAFGGYTSLRRPVAMVWSNEFQNIHEAIGFERRIKRWSRLKKEALIRGDYDRLPELSARGFRPSRARCVVRDAPEEGAPHHDWMGGSPKLGSGPIKLLAGGLLV